MSTAAHLETLVNSWTVGYNHVACMVIPPSGAIRLVQVRGAMTELLGPGSLCGPISNQMPGVEVNDGDEVSYYLVRMRAHGDARPRGIVLVAHPVNGVIRLSSLLASRVWHTCGKFWPVAAPPVDLADVDRIELAWEDLQAGSRRWHNWLASAMVLVGAGHQPLPAA